MNVRVEQPGSPVKHRRRITLLPTTHLGRWGVGLAAAFFPFVFTAAVLPRAAALGFVCGLAGGVASLTGIIRDGERAVTAFLALAPLVIALAFGLVQVISGNP